MTEFDRDFLVLDSLPTPSLEEDIKRGLIAREILDRHGFVEWTIQSVGAASPKTPQPGR